MYYKHIMIVNYDSSIINKFRASLADDSRVVIYDHHMFMVQATCCTGNTTELIFFQKNALAYYTKSFFMPQNAMAH